MRQSARLSLLVAPALLLLAALPARAQQATEDQVKAAFLPRFARYVAWPAPAVPAVGAPFQLCVVGRDPFGPVLDQAAATELIDGHSVAVRRMPSASQAAGCHIAFVQGAAAPDTTRLLQALRGQPILTVTDARAGAGHQGMIHFTIVGRRVRFLIDDAAAAQRGLSISSRLLALAVSVRPRR